MGERRIRGWHFTLQDVEIAVTNNQLLMLDLECSNLCNLSCPYCFRDEYAEQHVALPDEMTVEERFDLLEQAKALGCRSIKIVGAGEPLIDLLFWQQAEKCVDLGMTVMVNTNGITLGEREVARLNELGASVILKFHSFDPEINDFMVDRKGYSAYRDRALKLLIDAGFNRDTPTRLGFGSIVTRQNVDGVFGMYKYCVENNIFPLFKTWLPKGGTWNFRDWIPSVESLRTLQEKISEYENQHWAQGFNRCTPYFGGFSCMQLHYSLYVDIQANVFHCVGDAEPMGSLRRQTLAELWDHPHVLKIKGRTYKGCPKRAGVVPRTVAEAEDADLPKRAVG